MNNSTLHNRIAVVTHGATELGQGIAASLTAAGALVSAQAAQADELIQQAVQRYGRVDIVVNVHVVTPSVPAETMPLDLFTHSLEANLDAVFFGCQRAAQQMHAQSPAGGVIINITSVGGVVAIAGHAAFCAAMAGVNALTKILATEWAPHGIRVVGLGAGLSAELVQSLTVHPSLPRSEAAAHRRIPAQAQTSASDVGQAVVYLASSEARHINGTTLFLDGGWLADGYWE